MYQTFSYVVIETIIIRLLQVYANYANFTLGIKQCPHRITINCLLSPFFCAICSFI